MLNVNREMNFPQIKGFSLILKKNHFNLLICG